jgi:hypothetical protein
MEIKNVSVYDFTGTKWQKDHRANYKWEANRYGVKHVVGYAPRYLIKVAIICLSVLATMVAVSAPFAMFFSWGVEAMGVTTNGLPLAIGVVTVIDICGVFFAVLKRSCDINVYNSGIWGVN